MNNQEEDDREYPSSAHNADNSEAESQRSEAFTEGALIGHPVTAAAAATPTSTAPMTASLSLHDIMNAINSMNDNLCGELAGLRGELAELRGELAGLRGELAELRGELAGLRVELAQQARKIDRNFRFLSESIERGRCRCNIAGASRLKITMRHYV
eukprot:gene33013-39933_t